jgi:histone-binding protein RBBP4
MPQNPDLIATKAVTGEVFIFDRTKHSSEPERGGVCKPDIRLIGQHQEGYVASFLFSKYVITFIRYGLAWNPLKMGHILGGSEDMTICHW